MTQETPAQAAARAADQTRPPAQKPKRVSNDHGIWIYGSQDSRKVLLIHQRNFKALAQSKHLWEEAVERTFNLVLGVADLHRPKEREGVYEVSLISAAGDLGRLMLLIASSVAYDDGVRVLRHLGFDHDTRRWDPLAGLRRRGGRAVRRVQRDKQLTAPQIDLLIEKLRGRYLGLMGKR